MPDSSSFKFGVIAIASTVVIIILILGLALFSFLLQPEEPATVEEFDNPLAAVQVDDVDPALAIALLGGVSPLDVIGEALAKARPGTALATIVYTPALPARETAGNLLLLADRFAGRGDVARARLCYQMAGSLATLSPDLPDTVRADIFLQVGVGLTALEEPVLAELYLDQAHLVATQSRYLQAAYRQSVLVKLNRAYLDVGREEKARQSLAASTEPPALTALPESPLALPVAGQVALPADVQQAEAARWQAAQKVMGELVTLGGSVRPETLAALHDALLAEDAAKTRFFEQALQVEPQLSAQASIVQARINWQSIKYRIARQGFGLSLAPEWEAQAETLQADLSASYAELYRLYSDIIVAMPDASQIDRATEESIRRQILAGLLGHYPNYPAEALKAQLLQATGRLAETQPETDLRVSYLSIDGVDYYTLVSDAEILNQ